MGGVRSAIGCVALGMILGGASLKAAPPLRGTQSKDSTGKTPPAASNADDPVLDELLTRAQADIDNKDYAAAAEKYQAYLAKRPDDAQIHFQLGYSYTALQKIADARAEYQKATELNPQLAPAFLNLGLTELSDDPASAAFALARAVDLMPDQERPKLLLATALAHSGRTDDAIAQYYAAEKMDANDASVHLGLAQALLDKKDAAAAETEFRAAVTINGRDPAAHYGLGECLIVEKKFDEGAAELGIYLQSRPNDDTARLARASALIDTAKYDDALAEIDRTSGATRGSLAALKLRYDALEGAKRDDEALMTLTQAEALAPRDPEIHMKMAQLDMSKKAYFDAAQEFLTVVKLQPQNGAALDGLANAEYLAKDYADAQKAIDLLAQQQALPPATLFVRADCYDKLGKKPEALDAYEKFLAANTDKNNDMYFAAAARERDLKRELRKN
jgi:tetratricopeptide (TPR) repeat protein